jgi:putative transposase
VEGKQNKSGLVWREKIAEDKTPTGVLYVDWQGLELYPLIDTSDPVIRHGLAARVKYVRLVRRKLNGRNRFYVQLVCEGRPYRKPKHKLGRGTVGLDIGPSTLAVVSDTTALLKQFCEGLQPRKVYALG